MMSKNKGALAQYRLVRALRQHAFNDILLVDLLVLAGLAPDDLTGIV